MLNALNNAIIALGFQLHAQTILQQLLGTMHTHYLHFDTIKCSQQHHVFEFIEKPMMA